MVVGRLVGDLGKFCRVVLDQPEINVLDCERYFKNVLAGKSLHRECVPAGMARWLGVAGPLRGVLVVGPMLMTCQDIGLARLPRKGFAACVLSFRADAMPSLRQRWQAPNEFSSGLTAGIHRLF